MKARPQRQASTFEGQTRFQAAIGRAHLHQEVTRLDCKECSQFGLKICDRFGINSSDFESAAVEMLELSVPRFHLYRDVLNIFNQKDNIRTVTNRKGEKKEESLLDITLVTQVFMRLSKEIPDDEKFLERFNSFCIHLRKWKKENKPPESIKKFADKFSSTHPPKKATPSPDFTPIIIDDDGDLTIGDENLIGDDPVSRRKNLINDIVESAVNILRQQLPYHKTSLKSNYEELIRKGLDQLDHHSLLKFSYMVHSSARDIDILKPPLVPLFLKINNFFRCYDPHNPNSIDAILRTRSLPAERRNGPDEKIDFFRDRRFTELRFSGKDFSFEYPRDYFKEADCKNTSFTDCSMIGFNFDGTNFEGAAFDNTNISVSQFDDSTRLMNARFINMTIALLYINGKGYNCTYNGPDREKVRQWFVVD